MEAVPTDPSTSVPPIQEYEDDKMTVSIEQNMDEMWGNIKQLGICAESVLQKQKDMKRALARMIGTSENSSASRSPYTMQRIMNKLDNLRSSIEKVIRSAESGTLNPAIRHIQSVVDLNLEISELEKEVFGLRKNLEEIRALMHAYEQR